MKRSIAPFLVLSIISASLAQEKVPDPQIERAAFKVTDGFEVTLFAADPLIAKPIGMNFDTQGRLWVTSSTLYPQIKPGEVANDKIIMLEDKDGDGRAEAGKAFAEGLYIPTGVEIGDGGVYVGASTELLHFKDTDGDGKADVRKIILSGFGTEDTHHTIHTLRWGPDGQLYFNQSIYIHSHIETPHGPRRLSGSGTWRFRPRSLELEVLTRGLVNPWGHTFDRFGQQFATDGAGSDGVSIYIPGAAYGSWGTDAKRWIGGVNPGSPKYCGAEIVSGRHLPDDWQGNLVTADFRANRVVRFELREEGSGYTAKLMPDVIKSSDKAFRPVDVKMGPDGAIYIADWYNPVINHGEVDFRSPLRDRVHGRIWRLAAKNRPRVQRPQIHGASIEALLNHLTSPEQDTRHMARRELYERDAKEVAAALSKWTKSLTGSNEQVDQQRLEALWTYETINVLEPQLLASLLRSSDARIRAAATHALYFWGPRLPNALDLLATQVADEHPRVRLEAVIALGQIRSLRSIELAMTALDRPMDRWLDYALYLTINKLKDTWLPEVASGKFTFNDNQKHLAIALQALGDHEAIAPLLALLKRGAIPADRAAGMINVIASSGGPQELAELWDYVLRSKDPKMLAPAMAALQTAARDRNLQPALKTADIVPLLSHKDDAVRLGAVRLAGAWRVQQAVDDLMKMARKQGAPDGMRQAAIESLGALGGKESSASLALIASEDRSPVIRVAAIRALAAVDLKGSATRAAQVMAGNEVPADPGPLIGAFLARQDGGKALADALKEKKLSPDSAKLALRYIYSTGRPEPELENLLRASADINTQLQNLSPQQLKDLAAEIQAKGDPARGETVFRSKTTSCFTCHAIGGAGSNLGPDLSAAGTASPLEYLIESILQPAKNVKEGFEAIAITTKTNDFYAGIRVRQTDKELVLRDALSSQITIPLASIKKQQNAGSMMPTGLADLLTRQEFLDLVKFLSVLGTPGHDVTQAGPVVRRWRVLELPLPPSINPAELDDTYTWSPIYSTVAGDLPLSELPRHKTNVITFEVELTTPGPVALKFNSPAGIKAWINSSDLDPANPNLELSRGGHLFTIQIDRDVRSDPLKVTLQEAPNSPARIRIVGGR